MRDNLNRRAALLSGLRRFVKAVRGVAGRIALVGSIVTAKADPKDIDLLVVVSDDADIAAIAAHARRLQGRAQSANAGEDVFLADEGGDYIGRTCRWGPESAGHAMRATAGGGPTFTTIWTRYSSARLSSLHRRSRCGLRSSAGPGCHQIWRRSWRPSNAADDRRAARCHQGAAMRSSPAAATRTERRDAPRYQEIQQGPGPGGSANL